MKDREFSLHNVRDTRLWFFFASNKFRD